MYQLFKKGFFFTNKMVNPNRMNVEIKKFQVLLAVSPAIFKNVPIG